METIRQYVTEFLSRLTTYDYLSFAWTFFLFVLFLVIALMIRHRIRTSAVLVFFSFLSLFIGPIMMHKVLKSTLFKSDANVTMVQKLVYSDTLLVKGELKYLGRNPSSYCEVYVHIFKKDDGLFKNLVHSIKPYKKGYTTVKFPFEKGDIHPFKVSIEPFDYTGGYEVKLDSDCFQ